MPPQQTNLSSGTERDAAALRFDLSVVTGLLRRYWLVFQTRHQRSRVTLQDLNDRELMDIGLTRGEIDYLTPERAIETLRVRTTHLWSRGGM